MRGAIAAALLATALGGCTWLLGHGDVPQPRSPVRATTPRLDLLEGPFGVDAEFLGVGERIITATNAFGRVGRVTNPYGEDTFVFVLELVNLTKETVVVVPDKATLHYGLATTQPARTLADYRKRWPTWAVTNGQEAEDQGQAYAFVLKSLMIERQLLPHASTEGRLAFPVEPAKDALTLTLPYRIGHASRRLTLRWPL
jgi:hypothetical protein